MAHIRHYVMRSAPENAKELGQSLSALRDTVLPLPGSLRVELLSVPADPGCFYFIEYWASKADHTAAGPMLPQSVMAPLKSLLIAAPIGTDLTDEAFA